MCCAQLPPATVLGDGGLAVGEDAEQRANLAWVFDLLGFRIRDVVVLDTLLYDTGGHPVALRMAVESLVDGQRPPGEISIEDVGTWRADTEAVDRLRRTVLAPLDRDAEAATVTYAALQLFGDGASRVLQPADVVDCVVESVSDVSSEQDLRGASMSRPG